MDGITAVVDLIQHGNEAAMQGLVDAARSEALTIEDIAELARGLSRSGACLPLDPRAADLASTGGPSSLSTLICPLYLRAWGLLVPKLGVPGRPAGGIDVLQQVSGYKAGLDARQAEDALRRHGYIHLLADERWTPLDARLFGYRQRVGGQALPALVIASILAKKLAAGAVGAGLEIRVAPHGNFGKTYEAARENAGRFRAVADLLRLRSVAILTDAAHPFQPYIGRGEALIALDEILSGDISEWLADHQALCRAMAAAVATATGVSDTRKLGCAALKRALEAVLQAHSTSIARFDDRVAEARDAPRIVVRAERKGTATYDLGAMRRVLVERQRAVVPTPTDRPPDPAGAILLARPGFAVEVDEPLISVRVPEGERRLADQLAGCAQIRPGPPNSTPAQGTLDIV